MTNGFTPVSRVEALRMRQVVTDPKSLTLAAGWEKRISDAAAVYRTHATVAPLASAMREIGIEVPLRCKRVTLIQLLRKAETPTLKRGDFFRWGTPLLAKRILAFLEGDDRALENVLDRVDEAVRNARRLRKEARAGAAGLGVVNTSTSASSVQGLASRLDDALTLIHGAMISNNLNRHQIRRLTELSEGASAPVKPICQGANTNHAGTGDVWSPPKSHHADLNGDTMDASRTWGAHLRDNGQFGSHAAFDGMDDESSP